MEKEKLTTEILQHKIEWWLDDDTITELDESDEEHIKSCIENGFNQGELNHSMEEIRGWWKIVRD